MEERKIPNCGDGFVPRRYGITGTRERQREVQQQTELALLQYFDHFAGRKRPRKTKLRTNVKLKIGFDIRGDTLIVFSILEWDT